MKQPLSYELRSAARDINSLTQEELVLLFLRAAEQIEESHEVRESLRRKRASSSSLRAALELVRSELSKNRRLQNFSRLSPTIDKALAYSNH